MINVGNLLIKFIVFFRKLAHQSGLFYEDETEITGITEDLYHRKKTSMLLLDPKYNNSNDEHHDQERISLVDSIPPALMELITEQSIIHWSENNTIRKYCQQYLRTTHQSPGIRLVMFSFIIYDVVECRCIRVTFTIKNHKLTTSYIKLSIF